MSGQLWIEAKLQSMSDMVGNEDAIRTLRAFQAGFLLIYGPVGTGKTNLALAWIKDRYGVTLQEDREFYAPIQEKLVYLRYLNAVNFDIKYAGARSFFNRPVESCVLVDEAQLLTEVRHQARLKTLRMDERTSLVLITQDPNALEKSIRDRCAKVRLGPVTARELPALVKRGCGLRGIPYYQEIVKALNRGGILRARSVYNVIDAVAAGTPLVEACVAQE